MFNSYQDENFKTLPKYSPQVLIGNWYEERFHHNRDHPMPEKICKDGFRNYGTHRGVVIVPNKEIHPLNSTVRTSSALSLMEKKKDSEIVFKEKQSAIQKRRISAEEKRNSYDLLTKSMRTTYSRDYNAWTCRPRWMLETGLTNKDDRLGDASTRQNHSHLATYLPPIDAPRLVAM